MYSDEYLSHYCARYIALDLRRAGVGLEQYLERPAAYEAAAAECPEPTVIPQRVDVIERHLRAEAQAARGLAELGIDNAVLACIQAEAESGVEHLPRRHGTIVEPLHHRRWPTTCAMFRGGPRS